AKLLDQIVDRARLLTMGDTTQAENFYMGAVIDAAAQRKHREYIEIGKKEGRLLLGQGSDTAPAQSKIQDPKSKIDSGEGYFVPPTIIADVPRTARIACEEIFGPVLAVLKARDFDDGLAIANGSEYGLTGALYSNDRARIERARCEFHVGNLYIN